ncbi:MAG: tetratricopeptide repeat protein [Kineosporiaceae bacterium]|nr:tetratricopeptide repeat protein [Kineosporiaceae bacterium]
MHLGDYTREQSLAYLAERTGLDDPGGARQVADALGDLPLALAQAAGVITAQHLTYHRYLDKLTDTTLTAALPPTPGYPRRLPEAVLLSVQTAALAHPHARAALGLLSVLDPTGITRTLLTDLLDTVVEDHLTVDDADEVIGILARASLITFTADNTAVVMHRLIGRTLRETHPDPDEILTTAAQALQHALPGADAPPPPAGLVDDIAAQTLTLLGHPTHPDTSADVTQVATTVGIWLYRVGAYTAMVTINEQTLATRERVLGPEHPATLNSRNNLAGGYWAVGRHQDAITLNEQTLATRERVLGPEHPATLNSRNNLANGYREVGRHQDAITLHEQTLTTRERVLGPEHPDTLHSRNNLALDYRAVGRHQDAITLHEQTLTTRERVLGPEHPDTLTSRNNLANGYQAVGRHQDAITLHEQTLATRERVLGPEHPATLNSRNNLANGYQAVGRHQDAITLHEQTLTTRERVLGPEHPDTLHSRNNLANGYQAVGRHQDAITLHEQTLTTRERVLGPEHPDTLTSRSNLADGYREVGRAKDARRIEEGKSPR